MRARPGRHLTATMLGAAILAVGLGACTPGGPEAAEPPRETATAEEHPAAPVEPAGADANPFLAGAPSAHPDMQSVHAAAALRTSAPDAPAALDVVSEAGASLWVGDWFTPAEAEALVRDHARAANEAGRTGVVTVYAIPARDCGSFSAGGLTPEEYPAFAQAVADGLRGTRTAVVLEPDALPDLGACPEQGDRAGLLRQATAALADAGASVYLDAGNSAWVDAPTMADRLRQAGIDDARGFATNVSNFRATADERAYADRLAALLGTRYVIDTSRNGLGPLGDGPLDWCNPAGRALGEKPGAVDDGSALDAYLWVKVPGESDGECGRGDPAAGTFWPEYAIGLVERAGWDTAGPGR
ncbi:glycoside hydrolase family 6 protein [Oerskovia sp. NPDC056781]|uniref:glycoside hydrolase family 6 protein n=1 Tax=Oerskovia sp. NPDC056781 TaxID=3345942 RepID=UPI003671F408